jgi:hypothetical protein
MNIVQFHDYNSNCFGRLITGGAAGITQLLKLPISRLDPYSISNAKIFIC